MKMYEVGSFFGPVLVKCVSSAVLMVQVVCETTPCWLVNIFNVLEEMGASTFMVFETI
jgi:hypothetical protein